MEQRVDDLGTSVAALVTQVGKRLDEFAISRDDTKVSKNIKAQLKGSWILGICALAAALIGVFFG